MSHSAPTPLKRNLTDYFSARPTKKLATDEVSTHDTKAADHIMPATTSNPQHIESVPGLELYTDFVTRMEQHSILKFLNDPTKCTWRTDLSRRTMHFGGDYCIMPKRLTKEEKVAGNTVKLKPEIVTAPSIPLELLWILDRMNDQNIYQQGDQPQYCIVYVQSLQEF